MVWLDQLRAVAMYFVVIGHIVTPKTWPETLIYSFHMPLFFMISGMTFRPERYRSLWDCALDKAKKLLVPYFLLSLINIPWWILNWEVLGDKTQSVGELVWAVIVSNQALLDGPANALWFLPCLFLLSLFMQLLWMVSRGADGLLTALVALSGVAGAWVSIAWPVDIPWHPHTVLTAAVFFYLGSVLMRHRERMFGLIRQHRAAVLGLIVGLVVAGCVAALLNGKVSMHRNDYNNVLLFYASALSLSLATIVAAVQIPPTRLAVFAGQSTLVVLAFHIPMIRTLQNLSPITKGITGDFLLLSGALVYLANLPVAVAINRWAPVLVGGRRAK